MHLTTRNVNTAFRTLVEKFHGGGVSRPTSDDWDPEYSPVVRRPSRNGSVLVIDEPVTVTYTHPRDRVLFNAARDANPVFHLYEALWMLAGRNDVAPLAYYAGRMRDFSDDGVTLNGAYGYRWRHAETLHVRRTVSGDAYHPSVRDGVSYVDQLDILVAHLKADPTSRRAVLQMWNVEDDLLKVGVSKDVCCNLSVMFSLRRGEGPTLMTFRGEHITPPTFLDMTVTSRSEDLVWGLLGADYVDFTVLQEYVAARLGAEVGRYHHFTNNLHVYDDPGNSKVAPWEPERWLAGEETQDRRTMDYSEQALKTVPLVCDPEAFKRELPTVVKIFDGTRQDDRARYESPTEPFLRDVAWPLLSAHYAYKRKDAKEALSWCSQIAADDWRVAAINWFNKRTHSGRWCREAMDR